LSGARKRFAGCQVAAGPRRWRTSSTSASSAVTTPDLLRAARRIGAARRLTPSWARLPLTPAALAMRDGSVAVLAHATASRCCCSLHGRRHDLAAADQPIRPAEQ
jgi:hypothetical protein